LVGPSACCHSGSQFSSYPLTQQLLVVGFSSQTPMLAKNDSNERLCCWWFAALSAKEVHESLYPANPVVVPGYADSHLFLPLATHQSSRCSVDVSSFLFICTQILFHFCSKLLLYDACDSGDSFSVFICFLSFFQCCYYIIIQIGEHVVLCSECLLENIQCIHCYLTAQTTESAFSKSQMYKVF